MKLNQTSLENPGLWPSDYELPKFNVKKMIELTIEAPLWLHMGAGNIFRIFMGSAQQDLLNAGHTDKGILVCEAFDEKIIPLSFEPFDNLTLGVTLNSDGSIKKKVIASVAGAFNSTLPRLSLVVSKPSLQLVSLTITEKGYAVDEGTVCKGRFLAATALEQLTAALYSRYETGSPPLAIVSMDNLSANGTKLYQALETIAKKWNSSPDFMDYLKSCSFPWTMIDKITPQPSEAVAKMLEGDGYEDAAINVTPKRISVASFVNAEAPGYLIVEDDFPNGRPPLEKAGIIMTTRETVRKMEHMKVCACLNPLHTILAVSGMLLGYASIADCMKDNRLVKLLRKSAEEALPVVTHPGIIDPKVFLEEVLTERFPNPFIPDAPSRIAFDTSQKVPIRFGMTLKERATQGLGNDKLVAVPLFVALWLRYRMGLDDAGAPLELSPDPKIPESFNLLTGLEFGAKPNLKSILADADTFGVNLYDAKLGEKIESIFAELSKEAGAVSSYLTKHM